MPAYLVVDITVQKHAELSAYDAVVDEVVERYGGRFLVRGGRAETLEGDWAPGRVVILEFPNADAIRLFYNSDDYAPLLARRLQASSAKMIAVEGVERLDDR